MSPLLQIFPLITEVENISGDPGFSCQPFKNAQGVFLSKLSCCKIEQALDIKQSCLLLVFVLPHGVINDNACKRETVSLKACAFIA